MDNSLISDSSAFYTFTPEKRILIFHNKFLLWEVRMRLLKIILSYNYELCLLDENRYQKLWEAIYCEILT